MIFQSLFRARSWNNDVLYVLQNICWAVNTFHSLIFSFFIMVKIIIKWFYALLAFQHRNLMLDIELKTSIWHWSHVIISTTKQRHRNIDIDWTSIQHQNFNIWHIEMQTLIIYSILASQSWIWYYWFPSGKAGLFYSPASQSLWYVQVIGYIMALRLYLLVGTLYHFIIIIKSEISNDTLARAR